MTIIPALSPALSLRALRAGGAAALTAGAITGCGGDAARHPRSVPDALPAQVRRSAAVPVVSTASGRLLVFFKETVGIDPEASQLTIDRDGRAMALTTLGGPGGEHRQYFTLNPARLRRLQRLVMHTTLKDTRCCRANNFVYFVSDRGRGWRLAQGYVPGEMRPLISDLNAITTAHTTYNGPSG